MQLSVIINSRFEEALYCPATEMSQICPFLKLETQQCTTSITAPLYNKLVGEKSFCFGRVVLAILDSVPRSLDKGLSQIIYSSSHAVHLMCVYHSVLWRERRL
jgi:hypothetical protein